MSVKAMLLSAAAGAVLLLTACAQRPSSLPLVATPLPPIATPATPEQPQQRVWHTSEAGAVRADHAAPDWTTQRNCSYQGLVVENHEHNEDPSALGWNSALAGQSARDACLQAYQRSTNPLQ
jgi:hypothetical protein